MKPYTFPVLRSTPLGAHGWLIPLGTMCLATVLVVCVFILKYTVRDQATQYRNLIEAVEKEMRTIHVLEAEWSHLNDPSRIGALAKQYLGMGPLDSTHIGTQNDFLPPPTMPMSERMQLADD